MEKSLEEKLLETMGGFGDNPIPAPEQENKTEDEGKEELQPQAEVSEETTSEKESIEKSGEETQVETPVQSDAQKMAEEFVYGKKEEEVEDKGEENEEKVERQEEKEESRSLKDDFDINSFIKEKTDGKFDSFESLVEQASTEKTEFKFANEQIQKLNELAEKGVDVMEVVRLESLDTDKLNPSIKEDAVKIMKQYYKMTEPYLSDRDIEFLLEDNYFTEDFEDLSQREQEKALSKLKRDASTYKSKILDRIEEVKLPKATPQSNTQESGIDNAELEKQQREIMENWNKSIDSFIGGFDSEKITVSDTEVYEFKVQDKTSLDSVLRDTNSFWNRYVNENGSVDLNSLASDLTAVLYKEERDKAIINQAKVSAVKEYIEKEWKNPSPKGHTAPTTKEASLQEKLINAF